MLCFNCFELILSVTNMALEMACLDKQVPDARAEWLLPSILVLLLLQDDSQPLSSVKKERMDI